jgi:hypothetical protein
MFQWDPTLDVDARLAEYICGLCKTSGCTTTQINSLLGMLRGAKMKVLVPLALFLKERLVGGHRL